MKRPARISLIILAALFFLLFLLRLALVLNQPAPRFSPMADYQQNAMVQDIDQVSGSYRGVKNYASSKIIVQQAATATQVIDQKYERVANLAAHSSNFEKDRQQLAAIEQELGAVVQQENASGLEKARRMDITLGVVPAAFESLVERLKGIGTLDSITVNKTDKTAEYKALAAKRLSLEKTRDGLRALKVPGAALADLISLETRVLEIEGQIQDLGVSLGDFDEANSLCTVHYSLVEQGNNTGPGMLSILLDVLAWTLPVYLGLLLAAAGAIGTALLAGFLVERIRRWQAQTTAPREPPAS